MEPQLVGGRYTLDGVLGEGAQGQVYRVRHLQLGKAFALKIISPAFAGDNLARERFNQEAKLASEISHPNIVSVVDFGEDEQFGAYMVMELVEGAPLVEAGNVPMPLKRAIDILAQCADALDHIHKRGIVHGDVKAENIMMVTETTGSRRRQLVRLLDFGLARRPAIQAELEEGVSGSPHYIAPERAAGAAPSVSADIYALGVLGYLLLTGTLPFDGTVIEILTAHVHELPPSMSSRRTEPLDQAIEAMIGRALHKDPAQRHQSAAAFRYELNTVMDMLDMGRKRTRGSGVIKAESSRDALLQVSFEGSLLPQALISQQGGIVIANAAFAQLLGLAAGSAEGMMVSDTPLAQFVPGLMRALRTTVADSKPTERRARVFRGEDAPPLELTIWLTPLSVPGHEIHMLIRVDEVDPRKRDDQ